jgi:hypothetical protein
MPTIKTLIPDVQKLLETKGWFTDDIAKEVGTETARRLQAHFNNEHDGSIRLSKLTFECPRAYWYSVNKPELAEALPAEAMFKYAYGHIIEALAIALAKAAGHTVEGEQDAVYVDGITGHRDCIIDGVLCDVKSCSSLGFKKFKERTLAFDDSFGYLAQLDAYLAGSLEDPILKIHDRAYDWAIEKQLGKMCLYEHKFRGLEFIKRCIEECKRVAGASSPPPCTCKTELDGESGNIKLSTTASYSAFKFECFPSLRTFIYSKGPRYLTNVSKRPTYQGQPIPEVDRYGNFLGS